MILVIILFAIFFNLIGYSDNIPVGTENRVLMVNQEGELNITNVLATQAMLSSNMVAATIAEAKADAARQASNEASNMVDSVAAQIASNELVIYRKGFLDSFSSDISLPPGTKCRVTRMTPKNETAPAGMQTWEFEYAVTSDASGITPDIMVANTLVTEGGGDSWNNFLPTEGTVSAPVATGHSYTDSDGTLYPYSYKVTFTAPQSPKQFYIVYLGGDDSGTGSVLDIVGGVQGGKTATVEWGGHRLSFVGGLLTGVEEVSQ